MNSENESTQSGPEKKFGRLEDTVKSAFDEAGRKAREAAPKVKEALNGTLVDLAYGLAYGAGFASAFAREFVPETVKDSVLKGMQAGQSAGRDVSASVREAVDKRVKPNEPSQEEAILI